jgi:signal peptidase I
VGRDVFVQIQELSDQDPGSCGTETATGDSLGSAEALRYAAAGYVEGPALTALVHLISRLERENRALANQIEYFRAQLEQAQATLRTLQSASVGGPPTARNGLAVGGLDRATAKVVEWRANAVRLTPRLFREALLTALLVSVLFAASRPMVQSFQIDGISMAPTLEDGQRLLINKAAYWRVAGTPIEGLLPTLPPGSPGYLFGGPQRGEVVVFQAPGDPQADFIKRIIGLPGETILVTNGVVVVDGRGLDEQYVHFPAAYAYPNDGQPVRVPDGQYFVLGDNRPSSSDSHLGWFVPADKLVGHALLSYWPPTRWGLAPRQALEAATPQEDVSRLASSGRPLVPPTPEVPLLPIGVDPGSTTLPTPISSDRTLVDETFGMPRPGWPHDPRASAWFADGTYHLFARRAGQFVAIGAPLPQVVRDAIVRASFRKVGGAPGGGYGLILRDEGPGPRDGLVQGGRYYVLEVGDKADVGIWRRDGDHWIDLVPWTHADAVRPGAERNDLEARAAGGRLTLRVNNVNVVSATDTTLMEGGVGVFVGGDGNDVLLERFAVELVE